MPSRAPTYFHWSQDKPVTTNQTYGFLFKDNIHTQNPAKIPAVPTAFDYVRPFSNLGFFPEITHSGGLVAQHGKKVSSSMAASKFDINAGYTMGHTPVYKRVVPRAYPADVRLERFQSAPAAFRETVPKEKDIYLWHTLSGCLVHAKTKNERPAAMCTRTQVTS